MKKVLLFTMIVVLLFSLWGCASGNLSGKDAGREVYRNEQFTVKESNGELYLDFHNDSYRIAATAGKQNGMLSGYRICFSSVKGMKECIEQGKFSEADLIGMQNYKKASNGQVAVCNTSKLYNVKLPSDTKLKEISWKGTNYIFIAEKESVTVKIHITSKEQRDDYIAGWDVEGNDNLKVVSKEIDPNDGETTIVYDNLAFDYRAKQVRFSAAVGGSTITFVEKYDYEKSETLPWGISFWGENAGGYFYGTISGFEEMPSRDWLTSFAVVPYVETATE